MPTVTPTVASWSFVIVAALLVVVCGLAWFILGYLRLSTARGLEGDGLEPGTAAPAWQLATVEGTPIVSPNPRRWQLLLFADHCLMDFPEVVAGVNGLREQWPDLEVVVLARQASLPSVGVLPLLGLDVAIVTVHPSLYHLYNVRVMPFAVFAGPAGRIGASSLVNHVWQLEYLWRNARVMAPHWEMS